MKEQGLPLTRDLVFVGGGHAHALALRSWGMKPLPGVRVTVINPGPTAPYSGMLPGHIAGHYAQADLEIDLQPEGDGTVVVYARALERDPRGRLLVAITVVSPEAKRLLSADRASTAEAQPARIRKRPSASESIGS